MGVTMTIEEEISIAKDPSTTSEVLEFLSQSNNAVTRRWVVNHPSVSPETLLKCSSDIDWVVRFCVPRHPNCPEGALHVLKADVIPYTRCSVVHSKVVTPEIILAMYQDPDVDVKRCIAHSETTPIEVLENYSSDKNKLIAAIAKTNLKNRGYWVK